MNVQTNERTDKEVLDKKNREQQNSPTPWGDKKGIRRWKKACRKEKRPGQH